jgi:hypothetical protein
MLTLTAMETLSVSSTLAQGPVSKPANNSNQRMASWNVEERSSSSQSGKRKLGMRTHGLEQETRLDDTQPGCNHP